jgi:DNA-binding NarL/FixJ family response regulator
MGRKVYHVHKNEDNFRRECQKTMTNKSVLALVVSSSGVLQNGLLALMTTIPQINAVLVAEDIESALRMVKNHQPALIILDMAEQRQEMVRDAALCSLQVQDIIKKIKTQFPHIHLIVLVDDVTQQKEADALGADNVLIKGFSAQKFVAIVEDLIGRRGGSSPVQTNTKG